MKNSLLILFVCLTQNVLASTEFQQGVNPTSVGNSNDNNCQFNSIQAAITAGHDEIRVANNTTYDEQILISNSSLTIKGGYVNCFAANSDQRSGFPNSTLTNSNGTVVVINNNDDNYQVNLSQLYINNGNQNMVSNAAGVSITGSDTQVSIERSRISENTGRGIAVVDTASVLLTDVNISINVVNSANGGGIYCDNSNVIVGGASVMTQNEAIADTRGSGASSGNGGAVFATNNCQFSYYSGAGHPNTGYGGFGSNTAKNGGAIYAEANATINLVGTEVNLGNLSLGDSNYPVQFILNSSEQDGGAIYLDGSGTTLNASGVSFIQNSVGRNGGAIYANSNSTVIITRQPGSCWSNNKCNYFLRNASGISQNIGGGIAANSATLAIGNVWFEENKADQGAALMLLGSDATVEGSVFFQNRPINSFDGNETIGAFFSSDLTVAFSTFVDNNPAESTLQVGSNSDLNLVGTILYDPFNVALTTASPGQINSYCVYTNDATDILGTHIIESEDDPFVDRDTQDFHIADDRLIDACDSNAYTPSLRDFDYQIRGFDAPVPAVDGEYDIGADEDYSSDVIFKDGFNS